MVVDAFIRCKIFENQRVINMLLPDNMHPELSIYYNGAIILNALEKAPKQNHGFILYCERHEWNVILNICFKFRLALFNTSSSI